MHFKHTIAHQACKGALHGTVRLQWSLASGHWSRGLPILSLPLLHAHFGYRGNGEPESQRVVISMLSLELTLTKFVIEMHNMAAVAAMACFHLRDEGISTNVVKSRDFNVIYTDL